MREETATTCQDCRKGHYALPGGKVSNFPCELAALGLCDCWFCQEPITPAQARARDDNGSDRDCAICGWPESEHPLAGAVERVHDYEPPSGNGSEGDPA